MRRSISDLNSPIEEWEECLQPNFLFQSQKYLSIEQKNTQVNSQNVVLDDQYSESNFRQLFNTYGRFHDFQNFIDNRPDLSHKQDLEEKIGTGKRSAKQQKSGQYSKNYRERKKEQIKMLEEENIFLKRKVDELQHRLRQKQLQLNRIKYTPDKNQFNIQKISQELIQKLCLMAEQNHDKLNTNQGTKIQSLLEKSSKIAQFLNFYQNDGLGGRKTMDLLEYYMNEFLENMMRDRQKYYFLKCIKMDAQLKQVSGLDSVLMQAFQSSQEDKKKFMIFCKMMRPISLQVRDACREFYKSYKKVVNTLERKHKTVKYYLEENTSMQFLKRRLKIILWFEANKYRKEMRELRAEWIDLVRNEDDEKERDVRKRINLSSTSQQKSSQSMRKQKVWKNRIK